MITFQLKVFSSLSVQQAHHKKWLIELSPDEIRRRLSPPESLTIGLVLQILHRADTSENRRRLSQTLLEMGVEIPNSDENHPKCTMMTKLPEGFYD